MNVNIHGALSFLLLYSQFQHHNNYVGLQRLDYIRGLLEKYPTFGREKETGLLGALDT